jgi:hypothetical protein
MRRLNVSSRILRKDASLKTLGLMGGVGLKNVGFMKMTAFWDIALCSLVEV